MISTLTSIFLQICETGELVVPKTSYYRDYSGMISTVSSISFFHSSIYLSRSKVDSCSRYLFQVELMFPPLCFCWL